MDTHEVLLFYKYVTISDPDTLVHQLKEKATEFSLKGRIIVAEEGINGTVEGLKEMTTQFSEFLHKIPELFDMKIKQSVGDGNAFPKLSIKKRKEIVGTQFSQEEADPRIKTAPRIHPDELREWYREKKNFVVVDMRNSYEYISGHFTNAIDPGLENSRDLPQSLEKLQDLKDETVLTVCTGGVRCEKMSAYLLNKGFKNVYQLEDGIHGYMEKYPGEDFLGTLYTFDNRLTMHFGGEREIIGVCKLCARKTEQYVNCMNNTCHLHFLACEECAPNQEVYCPACTTPSVVLS